MHDLNTSYGPSPIVLHRIEVYYPTSVLLQLLPSAEEDDPGRDQGPVQDYPQSRDNEANANDHYRKTRLNFH